MNSNPKQDNRNAGPFRWLMRIPVPWVYAIAYVIGVILEMLFPREALSPETANIVTLIGAALFVGGAVIAGWGLLVFRRARTTTVPGEISSQLVVTGPYQFTRNPMYVGLGLAYLGEAGLLHQWWPLALLPFVLAYVNWVVIPVEERRLREFFGDVYAQYCARVRRW